MQAETYTITTSSIDQYIRHLDSVLWCLVEIQLTVNNVCGTHTCQPYQSPKNVISFDSIEVVL